VTWEILGHILRIQDLRIHQNLIHIQRLKPVKTRPWKVPLFDLIAVLGKPNDIMDTPVEGLPTVRVGKNLWIPFVGAAIRGKHNVTDQELTEPAFGMDLGGVPITSLQKGSVRPIPVEIVDNQSFVDIGTIVPEEVSLTFPAKSRKLVRRGAQNGVPSFASLWLTVKD